jgi:hypothetical protein
MNSQEYYYDMIEKDLIKFETKPYILKKELNNRIMTLIYDDAVLMREYIIAKLIGTGIIEDDGDIYKINKN